MSHDQDNSGLFERTAESQVDCSQAVVNKTPTGPLRVPTGRAQLFVFSSGFLELL